MKDDLISRKAAIDALGEEPLVWTREDEYEMGRHNQWRDDINALKAVPPAQSTICGYDIEHLAMIARVLQKEDLPPERIAEALNDIGKIVAVVKKEFTETLRKAVEQCTI